MHQKGASCEEANASSSTSVPGQMGWADGQMPLLLLIGEDVVQWCLAGNKPQTLVVSCDHRAQGQGSTVVMLLLLRAATVQRELLVCSQNGTLLCQPKGACPPACKASFWWCAGCLFCSLSALFISDKKLTLKM